MLSYPKNKTDEGRKRNEEMQEIYNVLFGRLGQKFFIRKRGEDVSLKDPKFFFGFLTRRKCNRLFRTKNCSENLLALVLVILV